MVDIIHEFTVKAPPERVFQSFATPAGLDKWWTKTSAGEMREGGTVRLYFGSQYDWLAKVTRHVAPSSFELEMTQSHPDWMATRVGCELRAEGKGATRVRFHHTGWPQDNNTGGFHAFAGRCICAFCAAIWNMARPSNTRSGWMCDWLGGSYPLSTSNIPAVVRG